MRTVKEIRKEITALEDEHKAVNKTLHDELHESRQHEIRLAAMEDALAGRKNSCKPRWIDSMAVWQKRDDGLLHCSYCGSLHPDEAVRLLKTAGTRYSGSDQKYGWPHKYYIDPHKFYNSHVVDASPETFTEFAELSLQLFGIGWEKKEEGIFWNAPRTNSFHGYQRWGIVGQVTCLSCGCVGGKTIGYCFCRANPKCHSDPVN